MFGRFWARLGLLLALGTALAAAASPTPQPAAVPRIVAIGDLHGDFAAWRDIARAAGLIDARGRWTGGTTVLVQAGDVPDRGPDSLKIIDDLMRLQREAARAGGKVVALVGNHEAMNMTGDLRYVSPGEYAAFVNGDSERLRERVFRANQDALQAAYRKTDPAMTSEAAREAFRAATPLGMIEHDMAWRPDGRIGRWVVGNPAVLLLNGTLFVHGGISPAYAAMPIAEINARVAAALTARDTAAEAIINDPAGPLWYRGLTAKDAGSGGVPIAATAEDAPVAALAGAPPLTVAQQLDTLLAATGARRIVIAHTPNLAGILVLHDGRLVRIDTGISSAYGGVLSYLEIIGDTLVPHSVPRSAATKGGKR